MNNIRYCPKICKNRKKLKKKKQKENTNWAWLQHPKNPICIYVVIQMHLLHIGGKWYSFQRKIYINVVAAIIQYRYFYRAFLDHLLCVLNSSEFEHTIKKK